MNNKRYTQNLAFVLLGACLLITSGCSGTVKDNVRNTLGLNKKAPDEFAVITRAPLEIPKNLTLPPPTPGAQRPQEKHALDTAKEALFGNNSTALSSQSQSSLEALLLENSGATDLSEDIRTLIDKETDDLSDRNKPVAAKLFNLSTGENTPSASIVDSAAEYERLKTNKTEGKDMLEGKTPMIEDY